jgi:hypothetical protein
MKLLLLPSDDGADFFTIVSYPEEMSTREAKKRAEGACDEYVAIIDSDCDVEPEEIFKKHGLTVWEHTTGPIFE